MSGRILLLCALLLAASLTGLGLSAGAASAQSTDYGPDWNRTDDPLGGAVGVHAGWLGGTGLSFKYPFHWWLYLQTTLGIWHAGDDDRHNLGLEIQYLLRQDQRMRLYAAAGLGYYYHKEYGTAADGRKISSTDETWYSGFGIGLEYLRWERMSVQVEVDFTRDSDDGDVVLMPQAGLFFYF